MLSSTAVRAACILLNEAVCDNIAYEDLVLDTALTSIGLSLALNGDNFILRDVLLLRAMALLAICFFFLLVVLIPNPKYVYELSTLSMVCFIQVFLRNRFLLSGVDA